MCDQGSPDSRQPFVEASAEGPAARSAAECHCSGPQGAPIRLIARIPPSLQTEVTPWNLFQGQACFSQAKFGETVRWARRGRWAIVRGVGGQSNPLANGCLAFIMSLCLRPRWQTLGMSSEASSGYKPSRLAG